MRIFKSFYLSSIILILLWLTIAIASSLLSLEYSNDSVKELYTGSRFFLLPIAVITIIIKIFRSERDTFSLAGAFGFLICAIGFLLFWLLFSFATTMCGWGTGDVLYVNRADSSIKIVERFYGCGAYDSDVPKYELFKQHQLTTHLSRVAKIDSSEIDEVKWIKCMER